MTYSRWTKFLVVLGLLASAGGTVWTITSTLDWLSSRRIQSGPRASAVVVSAGAIAGRNQAVVLEYEDATGGTHRAAVRFPLGTGSKVQVGFVTSVAYDREAPGEAEMAGVPVHHWQDAALAGALTSGLTGVWLLAVLRTTRRKAHPDELATAWAAPSGEPLPAVPMTTERTRSAPPNGHRHTVTALATALVVAAGFGIRLVGLNPPQSVAFPALPPETVAETAPAALPEILSAPAPTTGPLVNQATAQQVFEAAWTLRNRALADRDVATLRAIERDAALDVDLSRMREGRAPDQPPGLPLPFEFQTYVPRQTEWPARFLVQAVTTAADAPWLQIMVFVRDGVDLPWKIVLVTGVSGNEEYTPAVEFPMLDDEGYNIVPETPWLDPRDAMPSLARYWNSILETGAPPASGPPFDDGFWTSRLETELAGRQDKPDASGLVRHRTYHYDRTPENRIWSFGIQGYLFVCAPVTQNDTWHGHIRQPSDRRKWGPDLPPGDYKAVTADQVRMPCLYVPPERGPIAVIGADKWNTALRGT